MDDGAITGEVEREAAGGMSGEIRKLGKKGGVKDEEPMKGCEGREGAKKEKEC